MAIVVDSGGADLAKPPRGTRRNQREGMRIFKFERWDFFTKVKAQRRESSIMAEHLFIAGMVTV